MLEASFKSKDAPSLAGQINLNQLLARSPEEAARLNDLYPASDKTTADKNCHQALIELTDGENDRQLIQPQLAKKLDSSPLSIIHSHKSESDRSIKQPSYIEPAAAPPFSMVQAQDASQSFSSPQDIRDKARQTRMASLEEIKEMVTAAEQQAMPAIEEEFLDRSKRARFEGTYKEPTNDQGF